LLTTSTITFHCSIVAASPEDTAGDFAAELMSAGYDIRSDPSPLAPTFPRVAASDLAPLLVAAGRRSIAEAEGQALHHRLAA